jgi:DNA-binding CsgD family transcriptional regulator
MAIIQRLLLPPELAELAQRALDVLEVGVLILSGDRQAVIYRNARGRELVPDQLPHDFSEAIDLYVYARRDLGRAPPAVRLPIGSAWVYVRVLASPGHCPLEIVTLREEVLRDADLFRLLESRYGVTRREFQIVCAARIGKTNRQIAAEIGLAEGTVARHLHRILERFGVGNRTHLVDVVERLAAGLLS